MEATLGGLFDHIGVGAVVLDADGGLVEINSTAREILKAVGLNAAEKGAVAELFGVAKSQFPNGSRQTLRSNGDGQSVFARCMKLSPGSELQLIVLVDFDWNCQPNKHTLIDIFGLTPAEAALASHIAVGRSIAEVAAATSTSRETLRAQLKSIFSKTHARRQPELVVRIVRACFLNG